VSKPEKPQAPKKSTTGLRTGPRARAALERTYALRKAERAGDAQSEEAPRDPVREERPRKTGFTRNSEAERPVRTAEMLRERGRRPADADTREPSRRNVRQADGAPRRDAGAHSDDTSRRNEETRPYRARDAVSRKTGVVDKPAVRREEGRATDFEGKRTGSKPRAYSGETPKDSGRPESRRLGPRDERPRTSENKAGWRAKPPFESRKEPLPERAAVKPVAPRNAASGVRVSKLMAEQGLCSRREADEYIERGWVFADGERVTELGTRVAPEAKITLSPKARHIQFERVTILLNKPVGFVSGQPEDDYLPAISLITAANQYRPDGGPHFKPAHLKGLAPAGRLDIESTGLLVLTQDGRVARTLIGEDSKVEKEYLVRVRGRLDDEGLALLNHGLELDGHRLRPAQVTWQNEDQLRFVLREGRKRQIRRMCELVGLRVTGLKRVRIGQIRLGDLPLGQWRYLREDERFD